MITNTHTHTHTKSKKINRENGKEKPPEKQEGVEPLLRLNVSFLLPKQQQQLQNRKKNRLPINVWYFFLHVKSIDGQKKKRSQVSPYGFILVKKKCKHAKCFYLFFFFF